VFSVVSCNAHHHLDISATNRAAGAHTDGTSVTPSRCPIRQTSQQLSAAAAGVAADVEVVPVTAAAGN